MTRLQTESIRAVFKDVGLIHSYYWPRSWKGIDVGHFAETLPRFLPSMVKWDKLFYFLDGGSGISITGSKWFQRFLGISEKPQIKALAVAARAYAILSGFFPESYPLDFTEKICDYLWRQKSKESLNPSWGSGFKWRTSTGHVINDEEPSSLVTALVGLAFLDAYKLSKDTKYLERSRGILEYFVNENGYKTDSDDSICFYYTPNIQEPITNASAFVALFLRTFNATRRNNTSNRLAERSYRFIINNQEPDGSWLYFTSLTRKENVVDNFHTGFILETLLEGLSLEFDSEMERCTRRGLCFYSKMFRANGQPRFNTRKQYPIDIHDVAQGIIVFSLSDQIFHKGIDIANNIKNYVNIHMKRSDGRYLSRIYRFRKSNLTTPRWADCWMLLGLAELLKSSLTKSTSRAENNE